MRQCHVPDHCRTVECVPMGEDPVCSLPQINSSCRATHMSLRTVGFKEKLGRFASTMALKPELPIFLASCETAKR